MERPNQSSSLGWPKSRSGKMDYFSWYRRSALCVVDCSQSCKTYTLIGTNKTVDLIADAGIPDQTAIFVGCSIASGSLQHDSAFPLTCADASKDQVAGHKYGGPNSGGFLVDGTRPFSASNAARMQAFGEMGLMNQMISGVFKIAIQAQAQAEKTTADVVSPTTS